MKIKEFTLTDLIALGSAVALIVTTASQTYFYLRLDALWLLNILSPLIFFVEVLRTILLTFILILLSLFLEFIYSYLVKFFLRKERITYKGNNKKIEKLLFNKRKSFIRGYTIFSTTIFLIILLTLRKLGFPITTEVILWSSFTFGSVVELIVNKEYNSKRDFKKFMLVFILMCVTALNAEIKIAYLNMSPSVYLKDKNINDNNLKLLDIYQDKVVVFMEDKSRYKFIVLPTNEIQKIEGYDSSN